MLGFRLACAALVAGVPHDTRVIDPIVLMQDAQRALRVLDQIDRAVPKIPLTSSELNAHVLRGSEQDPASALTRWLAESIEWLPYHGALRGPRGVLIERRGNSLDQSLLLAGSLEAAGLQARLAHAVLSPEISERLYTRVHPSNAVRPERGDDAPAKPTSDARDDVFEQLAKRLGAEPEELRRASAALEIQAQQYLERVLPMTVRHFEDLRQHLAEAGVGAPADPTPLDVAELEALRDHWWVQSSEDGETWVDHDPIALRSGVDLGVAPTTTCAPDELPARLAHRLELRVVAERVGPEGRVAEVALTHSVQACELGSGYFQLVFLPLNARTAAAPEPGEAESGAFTERVVTAETEWLPMLFAVSGGGQETPVHSSSIYADGTLNRSPQLDAGARQADKAGAALGALGAAPVRAPESHWTSVWIEYEIHTPGEPPETIRRSLFDVLGEARRATGRTEDFVLADEGPRDRGLALSGMTQILPTNCHPSSAFLFRLDLDTRLRNQRLFVKLAEAEVAGREERFPDLALSFATPPLELLTLAHVRLQIGRHAERVYLGRLNVFANHIQPLPASSFDGVPEVDGVTQTLVHGRVIDIVANGVDVLAVARDSSTAAAWDVRLEQGVLDTVLENVSLVGTDSAPSIRRRGDPGHHEDADNPALWMQHEPIAGWRTLRPGADVDASVNDTLARAAESVARGNVVVLPGRSPASGSVEETCWWRVHAASGRTLGIGPRGWGRGDAERVVLNARVIRTMRDPMAQLSAKVVCFVVGAAARVTVSVASGFVGSELGDSGDRGSGPLMVSTAMAILAQMKRMDAFYARVVSACRWVVFRL